MRARRAMTTSLPAPAILTRFPQTFGFAPPGLTGGTLLLDLGWMDFLADRVFWPALAKGLRLIPIRPLTARRRVLERPALCDVPKHFDWDETCSGLFLRDVCRYDICVRADLSLADLAEDPNPERHAAASFALARPMIEEIARLLDRYRPVRVIYPQGHALPAAILRAMAQNRGISCLAIENCLRADRFVWDDRTGTTLASPIPREFHLRASERPGAAAYFSRYRMQIADLKSAEHRSLGTRTPPTTPRDVRGRRILLLGQVSTDSSVLFHIGVGFRDQMAVFDTVLAHAEANPDDIVLVKTHPKEAGGLSPAFTRYSLARYERFAERVHAAGCSDRVHLDMGGAIDLFAAIDWADLCVTINSQSGLEAACAGRPVVLCGDAVYGHLGSVTKAHAPDVLRSKLAETASQPDPAEARSFFCSFCEAYARPRNVGAIADLLQERSLLGAC